MLSCRLSSKRGIVSSQGGPQAQGGRDGRVLAVVTVLRAGGVAAEKAALRTRRMLLAPDILSCWRTQKWCLRAAGPSPTLQPRGMCSSGLLPRAPDAHCGEGTGPPSPWLSVSCPEKESVLKTLGFLPGPCPSWHNCPLGDGGSFFFLIVAVFSLKVLHPECQVQKQFLRNCSPLQRQDGWIRSNFCGLGHVFSF